MAVSRYFFSVHLQQVISEHNKMEFSTIKVQHKAHIMSIYNDRCIIRTSSKQEESRDFEMLLVPKMLT